MQLPRTAFIQAATWHGSLDAAEALVAAHPGLAGGDIHTAAIVGDDSAVRRLLARDPASALATAKPYDANALVYLCLSKYLRLDPTRSDGFLRAATALLDAGADPNSGFWTAGERPERETALYGAAGVAHHEGLTRLLIERGADPNDDEAVYHSPETGELGALRVLVESGKVTPDKLVMMLVRKHDWHDYEGAKYLLEHGTDPNQGRSRGWSPIHHAIARDNSLEMIELLLDHGARPAAENGGMTAIARAAHRGRGDVLELFGRRGIPLALEGVDQLIAACARDDAAAVRSIAGAEPELVARLIAQGGQLLAEFAGTWNAPGVGHLLDLGVEIGVRYEGDPYYEIAKDSTALHVAAWKATPRAVKLLIARGADVNARDGQGRTPLMLAVKACVDSYWTERRTPDTVRALLEAGASADGVPWPSGYGEVDVLLDAHRRGAS